MKDNKKLTLIEQNEKSIEINNELRPSIIACEKFTMGLNSAPKNQYIKERQRVKYLPISSIESELDSMFAGLWQTKNLKWQIVANEIVVSIDLLVFHPIAQAWITRTGVGAAQIRQNKGAAISDINAKIKNALEMDMPHAKSDAIKNAAKSLGKRFGRDLGRKKEDVASYEPIIINSLEEAEVYLSIQDELKTCKTNEDITALYNNYNTKVKDKKAFIDLLKQKQEQLKDENS